MNQFSKSWFEDESTLLDYQYKRLTPEETQAFEEYILDKPEIIEKLELNAIFNAHSEATSKSSANNKASWFGSLISLAGVRALIIGAGAGTLVFSVLVYVGLITQVNTPATMKGIDQIIYLETLRSSEQNSVELNKAEHAQVLLVLTLTPTATGPFTATLSQSEDKKTDVAVYTINNVNVSNTGDAILAIDTSSIAAGFYEVRIVDESQDVVGTGSFRLVK